MASDHDPLCDEKHTSRQACNQALASPAPDALIVSGPAPRAAPPARRVEPPSRQDEAAFEDVQSDAAFKHGREPASEPTPGVVGPRAMPEPSPWVTRAWEDTAAAVGAVATSRSPRPTKPAPPPPGWFSSHVPLVCGVAAGALALLFLVRRRATGSE